VLKIVVDRTTLVAGMKLVDVDSKVVVLRIVVVTGKLTKLVDTDVIVLAGIVVVMNALDVRVM
jgi:hypothetical protein